MNQEVARERILELSIEINHYNHSYYIDNISLINDFDAFFIKGLLLAAGGGHVYRYYKRIIKNTFLLFVIGSLSITLHLVI